MPTSASVTKGAWLVLVVEVLGAAFLADLASGLVHLSLDYQTVGAAALRVHAEPTIADVVRFKATSPTFRTASARDQYLWNFHAHHDVTYPSADPPWELVLQIVRPLAPAALAVLAGARLGVLGARTTRVAALTGALSTATQWTHFAAHARVHAERAAAAETAGTRVVAWLQDAGVLLHPDVHRVHHEHYDRHFCILNGWANAVVDAARRVGSACGLLPAEAPTVTVRRERAGAGLRRR